MRCVLRLEGEGLSDEALLSACVFLRAADGKYLPQAVNPRAISYENGRALDLGWINIEAQSLHVEVPGFVTARVPIQLESGKLAAFSLRLKPE